MPVVVQLPAGRYLTVRAAADAFLDTLPNPDTVRAYAAGVGKIALRLGKHRPLAAVADDEIDEALEAPSLSSTQASLSKDPSLPLFQKDPSRSGGGCGDAG
ncbi:hypothetical protein ACTMTI_52905 [Nonomuraea sp. H19]|uniref:hypothetical protein n=1 Tax=Nonomuraea sp. H19 TaxID=3452206 RepID=UPI003F89EE72